MHYSPTWIRIWESMLDADMNARYWRYLAHRYRSYDLYLKIFGAVTSSGSIASLGIWRDVKWLWGILTATATMIAIILPFVKWPQQVEMMARLYGRWNQLRNSYEELWDKRYIIKEQEARVQLRNLRKRESEFSNYEAKLLPRDDRKLLGQCQDEVIASRGLTG